MIQWQFGSAIHLTSLIDEVRTSLYRRARLRGLTIAPTTIIQYASFDCGDSHLLQLQNFVTWSTCTSSPPNLTLIWTHDAVAGFTQNGRLSLPMTCTVSWWTRSATLSHARLVIRIGASEWSHCPDGRASTSAATSFWILQGRLGMNTDVTGRTNSRSSRYSQVSSNPSPASSSSCSRRRREICYSLASSGVCCSNLSACSASSTSKLWSSWLRIATVRTQTDLQRAVGQQLSAFAWFSILAGSETIGLVLRLDSLHRYSKLRQSSRRSWSVESTSSTTWYEGRPHSTTTADDSSSDPLRRS